MKKSKVTRSLLAACSIVALSAVMYGCVHDGGSDEPPPMTGEPEPTAYEAGKAAIMAATTAADARAAHAAVDQTAITGEEAQSLQDALDSRLEVLATAARVEAQKMALTAAAGNVDTSDLSTAQAIADATTAINALKAAIAAAVDVDDTSMYQTMVDNAETAVMTAQGHLDTQGRMMTQRMAISNAVTMARTAVAGVDDDSTDSEVAAADSAIAALQAAIDGAADLPEGDADVASAQGTLDTLKGTLMAAKASRTEAIEAKATAAAKAATKLGKDMHAALGPPDAAETTALNNIGAPTLAAAGLTIDAATGAGALPTADGDPAPAILVAGDSAGMLGSWAGMDYALSTGTGAAMVTNEARVYTNQDAPMRRPFTGTGGVYTLVSGQTGADAANNGYLGSDGTTALDVSAGATDLAKVMASAFNHSGTQTHAVPDRANALYVRGTYDGAPGEFRCTTECSSTNDGSGAPSALGGVWHFKPDTGAMVSVPDAHYLYYGWWVRKDADGMPTAASAFAGRAGTDVADGSDGLDPAGDLSALTGSATYAGSAAGKYAINNVLDGTGHGGHFTADAMLKATFSSDVAANVGITGTIDNFRLNDGTEDPGWSVSLARGGASNLSAADGLITAPADDTGTAAVDESLGTVWSIDGNAAPASGTWSGTMYDEAPGDPSATGPGDGSNIPTTVTGTFYSEFSTIGRMVGAFGADKQ